MKVFYTYKFILYIVILLVLSTLAPTASAQHIVAGTYTVSDYYHDYNPNQFLVAESIMSTNGDTLILDMNGDNIMDYKIEAVCWCSSHWYSFIQYKIVPLNNNLIAIQSFDTCYANTPPDSAIYAQAMVKPILYNDTIDNSLLWSGVTGYMAYNGYNCCIPNANGHSCYLSSFTPQPRYIGVKLNAIGGPYFGWISIPQLAGDSIEVNDFACNYFPIGLDNFDESLLHLYPNPATNEIQLELSQHSNQIKIYTTSGVEMTTLLSETNSPITMNVSTWPSGVYVVKGYQDNYLLFSKKLIILRN